MRIFQAARLQQELQQTQDRATAAERGRLSAERLAKELEVKLEELESTGGKALKAQIKKLDQRVSWVALQCFAVVLASLSE